MNRQVEDYLEKLRCELSTLQELEREDIVRELEAHLRDCVEGGEDAAAVLLRLGEPATLAESYRESATIRRSSRSFSPFVLLRATLGLASQGVTALAVFAAGLLGYSFGLGLALTGVAKCIWPARTGAWLLHGQLIASGTQFYPPPPPAKELLGWWYVPLALISGGALLALTTGVIRTFLSWNRRAGRLRRGPRKLKSAAGLT